MINIASGGALQPTNGVGVPIGFPLYEWLEKYLPQTANGRVIITTRSSFFPLSVTINIDIFTIDEAVLFLKKRTRKSGEGYSYDLANALAERLQYLPLALEQAAAYIE